MWWVLDLCAGLGGFSQAFVSNPHWRVVRIEYDDRLAHIEHTRILNVKHWLDWLPELIEEMGCPPAVILAGPDCREFSQGYNAPKIKARREGREFSPDMSLLEAVLDIIEYCEPTFYVVENVVGSGEHFKPYLGKHRQKIGSHLLYGVFPFIVMPEGWVAPKKDRISGQAELSYQRRSEMCPIFSQAVLDSITSQSTLARWV